MAIGLCVQLVGGTVVISADKTEWICEFVNGYDTGSA